MIKNWGKYYEWADLRIIALLEDMDEASFAKVSAGCDRSLRDYTEHLVLYYDYFTKRESGVSFDKLKIALEKMSKKSLLSHWKGILPEFAASVDGLTDKPLDIPGPDGVQIKVSREEYLFCYTDHATYHRGQLITTYKAITGKPVVNTDFYEFLFQ